MTICPQVDNKHGGELCERELHGDSISHCAQRRNNGRQRPVLMGRANYAGDCYYNPFPTHVQHHFSGTAVHARKAAIKDKKKAEKLAKAKEQS